MTSWKEILAKERGPRDSWATAMKRKFEKVLGELEELKQQVACRAAETEGSYRRKISEGTRRGLARARARGVKLGGARPRKSKVSLNELRRLRKRGLTQQQIAARLGCSQALVSRRLREKEKKRAAQKSKKSKRGGKKQ